ncbi:hypothetical protein GALMADRAFT_249632 [Galerina marginata CBS 339.88]|uniref:Uncharacterized protein n=1 Tax=Galerina marginata (strain CBS 339.88) TaxID=685588 RepID=A0A067T473_GALM3|nr:hypothetical protein GALMADRAFT_249632 [Galerina marginata CBS 339.88]
MVKVDDKEKILCSDDRRDAKMNQISLAAMNTGQTQTLHRLEKIESRTDARS